MTKYLSLCCVMLVALFSCKKPYAPPAITANNNYLVVEGTINSGEDSTIIKLSRTVQISAGIVANPELHASVSVVSNANVTYPLRETGNGYYAAPALNLSSSNTYSLKIITAGGKTYQSDFLQVKNAPPIDSVNYLIRDTIVKVNVNTHDPANKTIYYRWSFSETYIIHAHDESFFELDTIPVDTIVPRKPGNDVFTCWRTDSSTTILLGTSAKLKQDVISQSPLVSIPFHSEKIGDRYSILVKQYALTQDAYNYWQLLKTNTEQLGTIFDAQPSQLPGNIHCINDPSEPVIGYLSAGSVSQMRIYIDNHNILGAISKPPESIDGCYIGFFYYHDQQGINDIPIWIYSGKQYVIKTIPESIKPGQFAIGYQATDRFCADCTLRGSNKPPSFWVGN